MKKDTLVAVILAVAFFSTACVVVAREWSAPVHPVAPGTGQLRSISTEPVPYQEFLKNNPPKQKAQKPKRATATIKN